MADKRVSRTPCRFAVTQRSTAECLGLFAEAQGHFIERGIDFHLVAFETAGERGTQVLLVEDQLLRTPRDEVVR